MTIEGLRQRDPVVLGELLDRHGRELHAVAYLILRDRAEAEDVVIDTLLAALDRGSQLRDPAAMRPWLLRIATNRALDRRRTGSRVVHLAVLSDRPMANLDDDERLTLLACVDRLAPRMRAAIVLRYYADLSVRDVAQALGTSENTVKTQLREALIRIRTLLDEREPGMEVAHG